MRRQLLRLIELSERPQTSIRLLPLTCGAHPGVNGSFTILDSAGESDGGTHVFCDGLTGGHLLDDAHAVGVYRACFTALANLAMDAERSLRTFTATADALAKRSVS
jgi:hypothetical protein